MTTLFIADLHLNEKEPKKTELFLDFLATQAINAEALYILGDFFHLYLNQYTLSAHDKKVLLALANLHKKNISIYFMPGNRDFLVEKNFLAEFGIQVLPDPTVIDLYGEPVLLAHGDAYCLADPYYLRYRKIVRHTLTQKIFQCLPQKIKQNIADSIRQKSKVRNQKISTELMDVDGEYLWQLLQQKNILTLIHGHTHRPGIHMHYAGNIIYQRYVLSDWLDTVGSVLCCTPTEKKLILV
jgi:UDP-2,3-diacylglucosamine hydrolase